jgi:DNA polymerase I
MEIHPHTPDAYQLFHEGALAFYRAEQTGMRIDTEYCERKKILLTKKIDRLEKTVLNSNFGMHWKHVFGTKTNINSNHQLSHLLYKVKKLTPKKSTASGKGGSTDDETLKELNLPELTQLLEMRKLKKIRDTYLDAYLREQVNGWLHAFFNLHLVVTYRSSSDQPNLQNIPKRDKEAMKLVRSAIYPRIGQQFLSMDFSGIEVRMAACYTKDEKLIYDVIHGDMHKDMAIELYMLDSLDKHHDGEKDLRQGGKNGFVFPEFYGDYSGNCAPNLLKWAEKAYLTDGTPALVHLENKKLIRLNVDGTVKDFKAFLKHVEHVEDMFWNERYKVYNSWKEKTWSDYQQNGYVDLLTGFRCGGVMGKKEVCNYPFQGSAFHCLLWTFNETDKLIQKEKIQSRLVAQVHDELTADCHPDETMDLINAINTIATKKMPEHWGWINLPLEIEAEVAPVDRPWAEKEFIKIPKFK